MVYISLSLLLKNIQVSSISYKVRIKNAFRPNVPKKHFKLSIIYFNKLIIELSLTEIYYFLIYKLEKLSDYILV